MEPWSRPGLRRAFPKATISGTGPRSSVDQPPAAISSRPTADSPCACTWWIPKAGSSPTWTANQWAARALAAAGGRERRFRIAMPCSSRPKGRPACMPPRPVHTTSPLWNVSTRPARRIRRADRVALKEVEVMDGPRAQVGDRSQYSARLLPPRFRLAYNHAPDRQAGKPRRRVSP